MKSFLPIPTLALVVALSSPGPAAAQVAAPSSVDIGPPLPQPEGAASPPVATVPTPTPIPDIPQLSTLDDAFKKTSIGKAADDARARVEIRQLENRVGNDAAVIAALKTANAARTDLEKRQLLRQYYDLYYGKMRRLASNENTRKALDEQKATHVTLLAQPRVRPEPGATPPPPPKKDKAAKPKKSRFGRTSS